MDGNHKNTTKLPFLFLGSLPKFKAAPEPTNIIWENLEVSYSTRLKRKCVVSGLVALFIALTFVLFTFLKVQSGKNKVKYPASTDCASINGLFTGSD